MCAAAPLVADAHGPATLCCPASPAAPAGPHRRGALAVAVLSLLLAPPPATAGKLFGPSSLLSAPAPAASLPPPPTAVLARDVAPAAAVAALLDGRDALAEAATLKGAVSGRRARLLRAARSAGMRISVLTALLPAVPGARERVDLVESLLVGATNALTLARVAAERSDVADAELPQASLEAAVRAADALLAPLPMELLVEANARRCRVLLAAAQSVEDMREAASAASCAAVTAGKP